MDRCRALIFIPALNEEETVAGVVAECLDICDVLVLDDGSIDTTSFQVENAGASVIRNKSPSGYDNAIRAGFEYAVANEFDIMITADADGQHSASDIQRALTTIVSDPDTALVIGTRNKLNRISEHLFSSVSRLLFGVPDPLSGLKAYHVRKLAGLSDYVGTNIGTLIVAASVKLKKKITIIDITIAPRTAGQSRFGHSLSGELKILRALSCFLFATLASIQAEKKPKMHANRHDQPDH
ncbi:glycosyltransferase family 2 protein [Litorivicinus sp.]|nr:glycosyltransferase family 2 protein [Litorivicinus sp.]